VLDSVSSGTGRRCATTLCAVCVSLAGCSVPGPGVERAAIAQYNPATGRLERIEFATTQNGRNNAIGIMDGTRVQRIEVDEDEDGTLDRWEFYDDNSRLEKVGFSRRGTGIIDAIAFYGKGATVERIEISTRGDGRFNRVEHYRSDSIARVEEDTNGDGRPDKWEIYVDPPDPPGPSRIETAAFDDAFRGTPNRRFVYRPDGTVLRVEVDPDGDGRFAEAVATGPR
jgi:hypothetical protein